MGRLTEFVDGVFVATSSLDNMTTTVVAGDNGQCLVVDPGVTPAELAALAADLRTLGLRPVVGWSTHAHWDHLLWTKALGMVPRYATAKAAGIAGSTRGKIAVEANKKLPGLELNLLGAVKPVPGGSSLPWPGPETSVIEHDGHAPGHGALLVNGVLIAGDMCSEIEIPTLDLDAKDPLADYRKFLTTLMAMDGVTHVVPGHGTPTDVGGLLNRIMRDRVYLDYIEAKLPVQDKRLDGAPDWMSEHHKQQIWKLHPIPGTKA
jgi:glyoxylase-like metal-dependent hydrolase (beta-lactamase superfamily II)